MRYLRERYRHHNRMIIVPPTITPRTRPELASFVIATIEAAGVPVPASSRLWRMRNIYRSGVATIEPEHPDFELALEADRDMQLLAFAFDQLAATELSDTYLDLLRKLISDSVLPQNDRTNSPGRDAGFEIYVGAVCTASHLFPVAWEEPDVTFVLDGTKYGLAAKRLKNIQNLNQRVSKAVKQIDRSGLPGLIVLDASLAFNPNNHRIRQMNETVFWREYEANFQATWRKYQPQIQRIIARADVLGIIVHDYHICQQNSDWQLAGMTIRIPAEARPMEQRQHFNRLSTLYTYGLPNQSDASSHSHILP
jgi:hypothetical protein